MHLTHVNQSRRFAASFTKLIMIYIFIMIGLRAKACRMAVTNTHSIHLHALRLVVPKLKTQPLVQSESVSVFIGWWNQTWCVPIAVQLRWCEKPIFHNIPTKNLQERPTRLHQKKNHIVVFETKWLVNGCNFVLEMFVWHTCWGEFSWFLKEPSNCKSATGIPAFRMHGWISNLFISKRSLMELIYSKM